MPDEVSTATLDAIRKQIPNYAGLSDAELTSRVQRLRELYPPQDVPRMGGPKNKPELAEDVSGLTSAGGMFLGGLGGAATGIPGGAFAGSTVGGAAGRVAGLKVYDWLGVKRPDETKFFGLVSLGEPSVLKEAAAGALEGATMEGLPLGLAVAGRGARNTFVARSLGRAAQLAPNQAVANTAAREGINLGLDEITQSPALRGIRLHGSRTAVGATTAQIRTGQIEEQATNAVMRALADVGPQGSPSAVASALRGEPGIPGVLGKIDAQISAQTKALYDQVDQLSGGKPIVELKNLRSEGDTLLNRPDTGLAEKGFKQTMKRSALGKSLVREAATPKEEFDLSKISGGKYLGADLKPEILEQIKALYPAEAEKPLTLAEADALRSRYGEIARQAKAKENPDFRLAEAATRLKNAVDADMADAADSLPQGSEIQKAYKDARSYVIKVRDKSFRAGVNYLRDSDPSELAKSIKPNDTELMSGINKVLDKGGAPGTLAKESMRRIWMHDFFFGEGTPGRTELTKIPEKAHKLSSDFLDEMFGPQGSKPREAYDRMVEIGNAAKRVDFQLGTRASTEEIGQAADTAAGMMIHSKFMVAGGVKRFLASHFLTKAVNDPKLYDMVLRGIYAYPKNPGRTFAAITQAMRMAYPGVKAGIAVASPEE